MEKKSRFGRGANTGGEQKRKKQRMKKGWARMNKQWGKSPRRKAKSKSAIKSSRGLADPATTWGKEIDTLPAELEAELSKVRKAAPPPPTDDPIYQYLRRVYRLRRKLPKTSEWQNTLRGFGDAHHRQISTNYIRLIIQLTAPDHVTTKMKHKYTAALQHALEKGIKSKDLVAFIKEQGGLNKCVELWSKNHGRSARKTRSKKKPAK